MHVGIDPDDSEIVASDLTDHDDADVTILPALLGQLDGRIDRFLGDGAFDGDAACRLLKQRRQSLPLPDVILPPRGTSFGLAKAKDALRQRDRHVQMIQDKGRMGWQRASGCNQRALVEATISRYKRIIGPELRSRDPAGQETEAMIGVDILYQMFEVGRPIIERIR